MMATAVKRSATQFRQWRKSISGIIAQHKELPCHSREHNHTILAACIHKIVARQIQRKRTEEMLCGIVPPSEAAILRRTPPALW
jgi:hypothetical protein